MDRVLFGRAVDAPLNALGLRQAARLARHLASPSGLMIHASPRQRTQQTAAAIAAPHGAHVHASPALDEIDFGRWAGCSFDRLQADPQWRRWNERRSEARTPANVTIADVQEHVLQYLRGLACLHPACRMAIVTHAELIRALVMRCLSIPVDRYDLVHIRPASMTTIYADVDALRVVAVNECAAP